MVFCFIRIWMWPSTTCGIEQVEEKIQCRSERDNERDLDFGQYTIPEIEVGRAC